jgi:hypothetical protein
MIERGDLLRSPRSGRRSAFIVGAALLALGSSAALIVVPGGRPAQPPNRHRDVELRELAFLTDHEATGEEGGRLHGPAYYDYLARAYPRDVIPYGRINGAIQANDAISGPGFAATASLGSWHEEGPIDPFVPSIATQNGGADTNNSGRETALLLNSTCVPSNCRLWVGAAGGGVWRTDDALASQPSWTPIDDGLNTNSIGSLAVDPNDPTGNTIYVGTGESSASGDSEAGTGLYRSTDGGDHWDLVPGSVAAAKGNAIGSIALDPTDPSHIVIGTSVGFAGITASANPDVPPGPAWGVYESTDAGETFSLVFSLAGSLGATQVGLDPRDPSSLYVAMFAGGVWRRSPPIDGDGDFHQVFATFDPTDFLARSAFALVDTGYGTRIYLGDSTTVNGSYSALFRVDDANVPASDLSDGTHDPGWRSLSDPSNGSPGFGSYGFCQGQCFYDMFVASPPRRPDEVWLGGSMAYDELGGGRSNGRAVIRSTDAGESWDDMTGDASDPQMGMHPDQHAIAFGPDGIAFVGSDGGLVRTSGSYSDASGDCASRSLSGPDLTDCQDWLSGIPTKIDPINNGLATIQFTSVSVDPSDPHDLMGGTQDNGTWSNGPSWFETITGDGGNSGFDSLDPKVRFHTFYLASPDVNFAGNDTLGWNWIGDPLFDVEPQAFYPPIIADPVNPGFLFAGLSRIWRTTDDGGPQAYLEQHCNEFTGDFAAPCGDWVPIGRAKKADLTAPIWGDRDGLWLSAVERAPSNTSTLWAATGGGRVFFVRNVDEAANRARFLRIDTPSTPARWISGIAIDPNNNRHAWISFNGFDAFTPGTPGHVFDVRFRPVLGKVIWTDLSSNIGDQPVTDIAFDPNSGTLFAATDFGVLVLENGRWMPAGSGLPTAAANSLTIVPGTVLYVATHGRGVWSLDLSSLPPA